MRGPAYQRVMSAVYPRPRESIVGVDLSVDAQPILDVIEEAEGNGVRLTPITFVVKAAAHALAAVPELNVIQRWGRFVPLREIAIGVYLGERAGNVAITRIREPHKRDLVTLQGRISGTLPPARKRASTRMAYRWLSAFPVPIMRLLWKTGSFFAHNLRIPIAGRLLHTDGWGAFAVSNIGTFGLSATIYAPPPPPGRHVGGVVVSRIRDQPIVRDGKVVAGKVLPIVVTIDHRAFVGEVGAKLGLEFQRHLTDPALLRSFLPQPWPPTTEGTRR